MIADPLTSSSVRCLNVSVHLHPRPPEFTREPSQGRRGWPEARPDLSRAQSRSRARAHSGGVARQRGAAHPQREPETHQRPGADRPEVPIPRRAQPTGAAGPAEAAEPTLAPGATTSSASTPTPPRPARTTTAITNLALTAPRPPGSAACRASPDRRSQGTGRCRCDWRRSPPPTIVWWPSLAASTATSAGDTGPLGESKVPW